MSADEFLIELSEAFLVPADMDRVWGTLSDPSVVASCIPGAALDSAGTDGNYEGSIRMVSVCGVFTLSGPLETFARSGGVHVARRLLHEFSSNVSDFLGKEETQEILLNEDNHSPSKKTTSTGRKRDWVSKGSAGERPWRLSIGAYRPY
jgi:hypothetical protein